MYIYIYIYNIYTYVYIYITKKICLYIYEYIKRMLPAPAHSHELNRISDHPCFSIRQAEALGIPLVTLDTH